MSNDIQAEDNARSCEIPEYQASAESKIGYISGQTFRNRPVEYKAIKGMAFFEGDIILGTVEEMEIISKENEKLPHDQLRSIVISGGVFRWPDGIIPFTIENNVPDQARVTDAIRHWENNTPIRFVRRNREGSFVTFRKGEEQCSSPVGMTGFQQFITLTDECPTRSVIHEIGHTVGLWHEQSREDRNRFVRIVRENIQPWMEYNFDQHITDGDDIGEYDYCSVMHYSRFALSRRRECPTPPCPFVGPTIEVLQPTRPCANTIGLATGLSAGDIAAVRHLYPWRQGYTFGSDVTGSPVAFQNRAPDNYNYELIVPVQGGRLRHYYFWYSGDGEWHEAETFGSNITGTPSVFQNRAPDNYNYELIVPVQGGRLRHYYLWYNHGLEWHEAETFGSDVTGSPVAFQNRAPDNYNYELIVPVQGGRLRHYYLWYNHGLEWHEAETFGSDVTGSPVAFQNRAPDNYNYELIVPVQGGRLRHYYLWYNHGLEWHEAETFGSVIIGGPAASQNRWSNSYEVIALHSDGRQSFLRHYWFAYGGDEAWHIGGVLGHGSPSGGVPVAFQNRAPDNYNYEVIINEAGRLRRYWSASAGWLQGGSFGSNITGTPSVFQNRAPDNYNYELIMPVQGGRLRHHWLTYNDAIFT